MVSTISKGIIAPTGIGEPSHLYLAMMAALLSSALWVNLATWIGRRSRPRIRWWGASSAQASPRRVRRDQLGMMTAIATNWVISPVLGGLQRRGFLWFIKARIIYQPDKIAAARKWVPVLVGIMSGAFAAYLALKG